MFDENNLFLIRSLYNFEYIKVRIVVKIRLKSILKSSEHFCKDRRKLTVCNFFDNNNKAHHSHQQSGYKKKTAGKTLILPIPK